MPTFDSLLMTRTTGSLTASESSSGLKIHGTPIHGMAAYFVIPSSTGTTNSVLPRVWASEDDSTYRVIATYPGGYQSWESGGQEFIVPIVTNYKYVKTEILVAGSTGVPNFGVAEVGIVLAFGWDWEREQNFE